jgi:hypothetical protein
MPLQGTSKKIIELYNNLLTILLNDNSDNAQYAIKKIKDSLEIISGKNDINNDITLFNELKEIHNSLYTPHGGMAEFFIWREDAEQRKAVNENLERILQELWDIFNE